MATLSFALKEGCVFRMLENGVLRGLFRPESEEWQCTVTSCVIWRPLQIKFGIHIMLGYCSGWATGIS